MSKDINEIIVNNYQNNISYLKQSHKELYDKLVAYENAVDKGEIQERYDLTYETGGFDIFDRQTQSYLYLQQSDKITHMIQESVNFKKNENVFETFKTIHNPPKGYETLLKLYQQQNNKDFSMKKIDKFVFFGAGLHIESIDKKLNAAHYLIVEDSLELFRLSLFTTPYQQLAEHARLYFCIACDVNHFKQIAQQFLDEDFQYNHYIKFFQALHHSEKKLKQLHNIIVTQSHLNFFYSSMLQHYTRSLFYLQKGYNFLNLLDTKLHQYFKQKPTLLLAPGPSLGKNIEWLQNNQNNFLIVALSATLPILEKGGIKPDIITHFDGFERSSVHFTKLKNLSFFKKSLLLFSTKTPQSIVNLFDKEKIFFFQSSTDFKKDFGSITAFCAGSSSYMILIALQVQKLYLLGLDLAVEQETLQTHSQNYHYNQTNAVEEKGTLNFRNSLIEVKGNFKESVKTTPNFSLSIDAINTISSGLKKHQQKVYNLSDGAFFNNVVPTKEASLKLPPIQKAELYTHFLNASQKQLQNEERLFIEEILNDIEALKRVIVHYKNKKISTQTQLLENIMALENEICFCNKRSCEMLSSILQNYTRFIYTYIFDLYNTQELNIDVEIRHIYATLATTLYEIATTLEKKIKG